MSAPSHSLRMLVGARVRLAREAKGWTQAQLADALGIADRQTITSIETGERKVAPEELPLLIRELEQPLEFFTDPHRVVEENAFSYRARRETADFATFERQARKLIETHRRLRTLLDETAPPMFNGLRGITKTTPLETVGMVGYRFSVNWDLGQRPALKLREAVERRQSVLVLEVDAPDGISGAACHLEDGDVILLNRREPSYRRHYTLGHEFFHLLTWLDLPPPPRDIEEIEVKKPKVEQLADAFTAHLLMPGPTLRKVWSAAKGTLRERVLHVARHFDVSGKAAYWRLVGDHHLKRTEAESLAQDPLSRTDEIPDVKTATPPFDRIFVQRLHRALAQGRLTVNHAADMLEYDRLELAGLFTAYGLKDPSAD